MQIQNFDIHQALRGYVDKIWVFKSIGRIPKDDLKLIVPNGKIKLIVPFHDVSSKTNGAVHLLTEHKGLPDGQGKTSS